MRTVAPIVTAEDPSLGEALSDIAHAGQDLLVDRLELLKLEVTDTIADQAALAARRAAGGVLALAGWLLVVAAITVALAGVIGPAWALAAVGVPHLGGGAALLLAKKKEAR